MKRAHGLLPLLLAWAVILAGLEGTAAGVKWTIPASWKLEAGRPMRVATYEVPAAPGSEPGECGIFYFGPGQGGSVEENLARWSQQFEAAAPAKKASKSIHELRVHTIELSGTYLAPSGPMMQSQGKKPGYRLLGAIVESPHGLLFFKCTGPAATLTKAQIDFDRMIGSLSKSASTSL
jgi:hypothetical protein